MRRPGRKREGGGQHWLERNEAHVDGEEIGFFGEPPRIERSYVGLFEGNDRRIVPQARMKLTSADVDRINAPRTAGKEHLRKSAGRGAHIETDAARDGNVKTGERVIELDAAARYPWKGRLSRERCIDRDGFGRLAHRHSVRSDEPGRDRGLGLGPALEQPAFDEQDISALARGHLHLLISYLCGA